MCFIPIFARIDAYNQYLAKYSIYKVGFIM
ncbi:Uncharacterised protein [Prevotella intermedia]|nr:Uncharacterised protein [Prevotella intermedia]